MFSSKDLFFTPTSGAYTVNKSLRFRSSASAYLNRTFSGTGNTKTWTWSAWVKRGTLGVKQNLFGTVDLSVTNRQCYISFEADNTVSFWNYTTSGYNYQLTTTQVFRDPSAWYHLVFVSDTSNSTSSDRLRIYLNGVRITAFGTASYPSLNFDGWVNANTGSGVQLGIGRVVPYAGTDYFDGYMADVNFIDGQALDASYFGTFDTNGIWQPIAYTGSYGTNGFYLQYTDVGATSGSNAGYGKDFSGNSNYWTTNNFGTTSTATTYDSMYDTPTNYSNGVTGAGNYCVLSPLSKSTTGTITLSSANLNVNLNRATTDPWVQSTIAFPSSGKWYLEFSQTTQDTGTTPYDIIGVMDVTTPSTTAIGSVTGLRGFQLWNGYKRTGTTASTYGTGAALNDVINVAVDMDNGKIWFGINNTWANSGAPASGTNAAFTDLAGTTWSFFAGLLGNTSSDSLVNFGQRPFAYTPPSGFSALNTQNLSTPTITNGASYMAAVTYTGTGSSQTITASSTNSGNNPNGTTFQPDFVWVKSRSAATDHALYDAVRGVQLQLESNTTGAETTETTGLTAFTSSGFTTGALAQMNTNTATYVAWEWNAGGSNATNTSGSITSTVRANTTAGFSVVTYSGAGTTSSTIGHGLGVAPSMFIIKCRNNSTGATIWAVYHASIGNTAYLELNSTNASATLTAAWNNTSPTSTVFTVGSAAGVNGSGNTFVAYCFAPVASYSSFGIYTGNGSADGPFIYTGFRPRFILIKRSDGIANWRILDTSRDPYNIESAEIFPSLANAESPYSSLDGLSNGFKIRNVDAAYNASGGTYIYAAFAENPFKISRAR